MNASVTEDHMLVTAIGVTEFGGPDALRMVRVPAEPIGAHQVRIRTMAATVNPTDTNLRAGVYADVYADNPFPWIPGMDIAGEVIETTAGVDHISVGDIVMGLVVPHGAYRAEKVLSADSVVPISAGADAIAAATLPMNGLTARRALDLMDLQPGQVLAVTGAAGAFGGYIVELAKVDGLVVVADAAEVDVELVSSLGADFVVRRGDDVAERIRAGFPDGVDGLADGSIQGAAVLPAVKDGGVVSTVRNYRGDGRRGVQVFPVLVSAMDGRRDALDGLRQHVEDGLLSLRVARTFHAADASEAHHLLERGGIRGRLVLTF